MQVALLQQKIHWLSLNCPFYCCCFKALKIEKTPNGLRLIQPNGDDSIQISGQIWKCDQCDRVFTQKYKQKEHELVFHSSQLPYECWLCHKLYKTLGRVKAHIKTHIPDGGEFNGSIPVKFIEIAMKWLQTFVIFYRSQIELDLRAVWERIWWIAGASQS